ncbi:MAG TPA: bifunctional precorrin-2 dehydrogenase/sirohydrochlorin ferrochelatase [Polyangiaceae bacterium]|jgi:siroheme synthase-like protein|nr:bifunctional precorrin-2 dehydrogenase/sirohydrochlorin ferrochelatase [Polyangiaceae bacterium]
MRSDVFPVGLKLEGKLCLVVGTGREADRRTEALLAAGARVQVVSERPTEELERHRAKGDVALAQRAFEDGDLDGVWLAVYTDMDVAVATRIGAVAEARRVFFCAVDRPAQSSYSHAAIVKAGPVSVAISTDGRAPLLARKLRDELARVFDEAHLAEFADELSRLRDHTAQEERRPVLEAAAKSVRFEGRLVLRNDEAGQDGWPKRS